MRQPAPAAPLLSKLRAEGAGVGGDHRHRPLRRSGRGLHPAVLEPSNGPEFVGRLRLGSGLTRTGCGREGTAADVHDDEQRRRPAAGVGGELFRPLGSEGHCLGRASCIHLVAILHFFPILCHLARAAPDVASPTRWLRRASPMIASPP